MNRDDTKPGLRVAIVIQADQSSDKLRDEVNKNILTKPSRHLQGIKVLLTDGQGVRVKEIYDA